MFLPSSDSRVKSGAGLPATSRLSSPAPPPGRRAARKPKKSMAAPIPDTKNKAAGFRFTKTSLKRKPVQEREISRDDAEASEHQQGPQNDQQAARGHLQRVHVRAEAAVKLEEALDAKRGQQ